MCLLRLKLGGQLADAEDAAACGVDDLALNLRMFE
jgi:hypothetical protein